MKDIRTLLILLFIIMAIAVFVDSDRKQNKSHKVIGGRLYIKKNK